MNKPKHASIAARTIAQISRLPRTLLGDLKAAAAVRPLTGPPPAGAGATLAQSGDPAFDAYAEAQRQAAEIAGILSHLPATDRIAEIVTEAEDEYLPSGPPMSPLTGSYFSMWSLFDACAGTGRETLGTTMLAAGATIGLSDELRSLIERLQRSRMGVYLHEGVDGGLVVLRDLVTDQVQRCFVAAGYVGKRGELWFVRLAPPPFAAGDPHVAMTTPYVILGSSVAQWLAYFERVAPAVGGAERVDAAERHLKYGPTRRYWHEFVFEGYVNHVTEAVFLAGMPDIAETRPHSPRYRGPGA